MTSVKTHMSPKLAGVVGWPVDHSLSPLIHTIWAHRAGCDGYYIPVATPPTYDDFANMMDSLQAVGFKGVNVTIPHKEHALRYAGDASPIAAKAGAANMLTFGADGPYADNSDVAGFAAAFLQGCDRAQPLGRAVVLGAGGAARAIVLALQAVGVQEIIVTNRTRKKAEAIAHDLNTQVADWETRNETMRAANVIVNTTSLGMTGQPPLDIETSVFAGEAIVADIVYAPLETGLLKNAKAKGCVTIDGLDMLMHQAVPGFHAWFGGNAAVDDALRTELVRALDRRSCK